MKKWIIPVILIVAIAFWAIGVNNTAVDLEESTKNA